MPKPMLISLLHLQTSNSLPTYQQSRDIKAPHGNTILTKILGNSPTSKLLLQPTPLQINPNCPCHRTQITTFGRGGAIIVSILGMTKMNAVRDSVRVLNAGLRAMRRRTVLKHRRPRGSALTRFNHEATWGIPFCLQTGLKKSRFTSQKRTS